jgi:hypothetical protein
VALAFGMDAVRAQHGVPAHKAQSAGGTSQAQATPVTFGDLFHARLREDREVVQWRRFRDSHGQFVSVQERVHVVANGTQDPRFAIAFVGVQGEVANSLLSQRWMSHYRRHAALFFRHGEFQVRDLAVAQANYSLHCFGSVVRAGRAAHRVVVFPRHFDKAIWVLEVDSETFVPLYTAEFDMQMRLLSEIEVETFSRTPGAFVAWTPTMVVRPQSSFQTAKTYLGGHAGLLEPDAAVTPEFRVRRVDVNENPLNGDRTLVLAYSDGIDEFFVTEVHGAVSPFESLPALDKSDPSHTIGRYRDPALRVLVFWDDDVSYHVAGRGSLQRLDEVARTLLVKAVATR